MSIMSGTISALVMTIFKAGSTMNFFNCRPPHKSAYPKSLSKLFFMAFIVAISSFYSYASWASCSITGPIDRLIANIPTGDTQIDGSVPINTELRLLYPLYDVNLDTTVSCAGDKPTLEINSNHPITGTYNGANVYETGIPGIGMTLYQQSPGVDPDGTIIGYLPITKTSTTNSRTISQNGRYGIVLIKTGDIYTDGQIPTSSILFRGNISNYGDLNVMNVRLARPISIKILRPTCTVNRPNFNVDLGAVSVADFNSSGRTTPKDFAIDLTCTGGTSTRNVHVTLTDANNPGNTTTQLNLSPDSDALGIALEVNNRYGLVNFGPDLSGTGNPGQWFDGAAGVGSYSIPLSVNYVRLPGPIKGGSANSGVTYTLNYD